MTFSTFASPGVSLQGGGGSGGGGTPGGSNTQIQYNSSGTFAGASGLTTNGTELTIASGTKTADAPVLNMSQTWNNGAVTFTGLKFNVTDTASNPLSAALEIQYGGSGSTYMRVGKGAAGYAQMWLAPGITPTVSNYIISTTGSVTYYNTSSRHNFVIQNGSDQFTIDTSRVSMPSTHTFGFSSTASSSGTLDTILTRRAAANLRLGAADAGATTATVTITIAAPGVVTWTSHGFGTGTPVVFTTTGALPTGITSGTTYYAVVVDANTFQIASSVANAIAATPTVITTSGSQSGTHTGTRYNITQRLSMQSVTGVTDRLGADLIITGSQGTGTGAGGSIIFQVAPAGGTSNGVQNALATALTIGSDRVVTVAANASSYAQIAMADRGTVLSIYATAFGVQSLLVSAPGGITVYNDTGSLALGALSDVKLFRDDANKLALRNGGTSGTPVPQTFRVYNWTDGTNGEYLSVQFTSNLARIGTNGAGTGVSRELLFGVGGGSQWGINTAGHLITYGSDNTYDIGASGGSRPRNVFVANNTTSSGFFTGTITGVYGTTGSGPSMRFSGNNIVLHNNDSTQNNFDRLQFGGTSASFPALKRSSASLIVRLADDTANAALESASLKTDAPAGGTAATWKLGVRVAATTLLDTTQYIEVDVGGTLYKLAVVTT